MIVFPSELRMYHQRHLTWRKTLRKVNQAKTTNNPSANQRHIMQKTKLENQREDSRNAHSNDDGRGPTQTIHRFFSRTHGILVLAAVACALPAQSQAAIVVFDPPDAVSTMIGGINPEGTITGGYRDANNDDHGFLRTLDGQFTTFDAPGALSAFPQGATINSAGVITGTYGKYAGSDPFFGTFYTISGFLRLADGTTFNIDPPPAYSSFPAAINDEGTIAGSYGAAQDGSNHFYVRAADGTFTEFDPEPGARPASIGINPEGTLTGSYLDSNFIPHSFVRTARGTITLFDAPDAVNGTAASSISPSRAITGYYVDSNNNAHGFLRNWQGHFTTFDPQGSISTYPSGIAPNGAIAGNYNDVNYQSHGFVRAKNGKITTFDPQSSMSTIVTGINPGGVISGYYFDANFNTHGFVFQTDADDESHGANSD